MDYNRITGRTFSQTTTGEKLADGFWRIHVITTETITYPDGHTEEESLESECLDRDFDTAHQIALQSVLTELNELVYTRGYDSLVVAVKENEDGSDVIPDETTPTQ